MDVIKNNFFKIDGLEIQFRSLKEAKNYIKLSCSKEFRLAKLNKKSIVRIINGVKTSKTPIKIDNNGGYGFGRTNKMI